MFIQKNCNKALALLQSFTQIIILLIPMKLRISAGVTDIVSVQLWVLILNLN